jgi:hypothetical protein
MATFTLIVTMMFSTSYHYPNYTFATVPGFKSEESCWAGARQFKRDHQGLGVSFRLFSCQKVQ